MLLDRFRLRNLSSSLDGGSGRDARRRMSWVSLAVVLCTASLFYFAGAEHNELEPLMSLRPREEVETSLGPGTSVYHTLYFSTDPQIVMRKIRGRITKTRMSRGSQAYRVDFASGRTGVLWVLAPDQSRIATCSLVLAEPNDPWPQYAWDRIRSFF
jgi:hypothetical protein